VVNSAKNIVESFVENQDTDLKEKIFAEFNTLTVVYGIPAEKFLAMAKAKEDEEEDIKQAQAKDAATRAQQNAAAAAANATANARPDQKAGGTGNGATAPVPSAGSGGARGFDQKTIEANAGTYSGPLMPPSAVPAASSGLDAKDLFGIGTGTGTGAPLGSSGPIKPYDSGGVVRRKLPLITTAAEALRAQHISPRS
jgi:hypothetical protein